MTVSDAIRTRRAVRQFTDQPLPDEAIRAILNAGRRAQSSKNTQPWHFIAIRDKDTLQKLADSGPFAKHLAGAALGVAMVSPDPSSRWSIPFDLGQAAAQMQLVAWELGIGSCIGAIYDQAKAKVVLGIAEDLHFYAALSFGYPAPSESRSPRANGRKSFDDVVRWEKW